MRIYIAKFEPSRIGGGWSFANNLNRALSDNVTTDYAASDIYFITSASMVSREEVDQAKRDGKKVVLRIDNIIRNSRNRNTGMSRMKDFAAMADYVVFQSEFAADLLGPYLKPHRYRVIINAVDQSVFHPRGRTEDDMERYLYSKYSSDETKNWEMARLAYQMVADSNTILNLAGRFDGDLASYNFDFYQNEQVKYWGLVEDKQLMAEIYRQSDYFLYSYFNDACSNTVIEALCCGCEIIDVNGMAETGGTPEIMRYWQAMGDKFFTLDRLKSQYQEVFDVV